MRRGELRRYVRPSSPEVPRIVLILSSNSLNSSERPWVLAWNFYGATPATFSQFP